MISMFERCQRLREIEDELRSAAEVMPGELSVVNRLYYRTIELAEQVRAIRLRCSEEDG